MAGVFQIIGRRLAHAWNAFRSLDVPIQQVYENVDLGASYGRPPTRTRLRYTNEKSIVSAIYTRIAVDVAAVPIYHARVDSNGQFVQQMNTGLNDCLTVEANIDQAGTMFRQDIVQTLFDEGVAAIVPVDTTLNPIETGGYDISSMRVGRILQWYPRHVRVRVYNDDPKVGLQRDIVLPKSMVAIVENPLYSVMNEPSSTLQRLLRKLSLLDAVDEQSASGNLDLIIQLPYVIKTESRRAEAQKRLKEVELQLKGSQYGIAYTDGTEKITQLNRPVSNNLMDQVKYLTEMLYSQLGLTDTVLNGSADEKTMIGYYTRTIEPILVAITEAMARAFLTKTARSQNQAIVYIRDPFKLVPISDLAEVADKFRRNEVLTGNEMRGVIGFMPSNDPNASKLQNPNLPPPNPPPSGPAPNSPAPVTQGDNSQNGT